MLFYELGCSSNDARITTSSRRYSSWFMYAYILCICEYRKFNIASKTSEWFRCLSRRTGWNIELKASFCLIGICLAIVSTNYEIERKKSEFENFNFMWRMGKFRRIRFVGFIGIITVENFVCVCVFCLRRNWLFLKRNI